MLNIPKQSSPCAAQEDRTPLDYGNKSDEKNTLAKTDLQKGTDLSSRSLQEVKNVPSVDKDKTEEVPLTGEVEKKLLVQSSVPDDVERENVCAVNVTTKDDPDKKVRTLEKEEKPVVGREMRQISLSVKDDGKEEKVHKYQLATVEKKPDIKESDRVTYDTTELQKKVNLPLKIAQKKTSTLSIDTKKQEDVPLIHKVEKEPVQSLSRNIEVKITYASSATIEKSVISNVEENKGSKLTQKEITEGKSVIEAKETSEKVQVSCDITKSPTEVNLPSESVQETSTLLVGKKKQEDNPLVHEMEKKLLVQSSLPDDVERKNVCAVDVTMKDDPVFSDKEVKGGALAGTLEKGEKPVVGRETRQISPSVKSDGKEEKVHECKLATAEKEPDIKESDRVTYDTTESQKVNLPLKIVQKKTSTSSIEAKKQEDVPLIHKVEKESVQPLSHNIEVKNTRASGATMEKSVISNVKENKDSKLSEKEMTEGKCVTEAKETSEKVQVTYDITKSSTMVNLPPESVQGASTSLVEKKKREDNPLVHEMVKKPLQPLFDTTKMKTKRASHFTIEKGVIFKDEENKSFTLPGNERKISKFTSEKKPTLKRDQVTIDITETQKEMDLLLQSVQEATTSLIENTKQKDNPLVYETAKKSCQPLFDTTKMKTKRTSDVTIEKRVMFRDEEIKSFTLPGNERKISKFASGKKSTLKRDRVTIDTTEAQKEVNLPSRSVQEATTSLVEKKKQKDNPLVHEMVTKPVQHLFDTTKMKSKRASDVTTKKSVTLKDEEIKSFTLPVDERKKEKSAAEKKSTLKRNQMTYDIIGTRKKVNLPSKSEKGASTSLDPLQVLSDNEEIKNVCASDVTIDKSVLVSKDGIKASTSSKKKNRNKKKSAAEKEQTVNHDKNDDNVADLLKMVDDMIHLEKVAAANKYKDLPLVIEDGNYLILGWAIDTSGCRLIDELCLVATFSNFYRREFYMIPKNDIQLLPIKRNMLRLNIMGQFHRLKSIRTDWAVKKSCEAKGLDEYITSLERVLYSFCCFVDTFILYV